MNGVSFSIPDLVKRFTATPFKLITSSTVLETNDLEMLEEFDRAGLTPRLAQLAPGYQLRVVREANFDGNDDPEERLFAAGDLRILLVGDGSVVVVDRAQGTCFAFLDHDVANSSFARKYLPTVLEQPER